MDTNMDNSKLVPKVLKLQSHQRLGQNTICLLIRRHILELHCSSLHHILDIVISNLYVLRIIMEHMVLEQLHTTLVVTEYTSRLYLDIEKSHK